MVFINTPCQHPSTSNGDGVNPHKSAAFLLVPTGANALEPSKMERVLKMSL